jgi:hypothetical protein
VNAHGLIAGVLNRTGSLGPLAGRGSRGALPLRALRHASAAAAAADLAGSDAAAYRSFNLVVADTAGAFFLRGLGHGTVEATMLPPGLHMVTAADPDDPDHPRVARHRPNFAAATAPEPPDWGQWPALLSDDRGPPQAALNVPPTNGFGTASSALLALGEVAPGVAPQAARQFLFAAGAPGQAPFLPIAWPGAPPRPAAESRPACAAPMPASDVSRG